MTTELHDFIIVGSGCTGAMAAQTLVDGGASVLMLDGGIENPEYEGKVPDRNFIELRRTDDRQDEYFLGHRFESIPDGEVGTGAQITPSRRHLTELVDQYLPLVSTSFFPMESLATGGLGGGWGLGCCVFSETELTQAGLAPAAMRDAYQAIADRIGISGSDDAASPYTHSYIRSVQPATPVDPAAGFLLQRYERQITAFRQKGFYLGRPALALLTQPKDGRQPIALHDLDFYSDAGQAAYRPKMTIEKLRRRLGLQFTGGVVVTRFEELDAEVIVHGVRIGDHAPVSWRCRRLVLSPGVLGTARIVLRSLPGRARLPLLCNPYSYIPFLVPRRLGKAMPDRNTGFAQLSLFHDPLGDQSDVAMASLYTYRSLLLFRLLREVPLNFRDARLLMQWMLPGIMIMGLHHPEKAGDGKWLQLVRDAASPTGDKLSASYHASEQERHTTLARERAFTRAMRKLGAWKMQRIDPGFGASIHYAGVLPFGEAEDGRTLAADGRIRGTKNVYVADGSGFRYLPAKGLTLSLMANAHLVASRLIERSNG